MKYPETKKPEMRPQSGRAVRALLLASLLAAVAAPTFAAQTVSLVEMTRATAGRPAEMVVTGSLRGADALGVYSVTVEEGALVIVIRARFIPVPHDNPFAFPFELPPLPAGMHPVILKTRAHDGGEVAEAARSMLVVAGPTAARLEPLGAGFYRLRVNGGGGPADPDFVAAPTFAGDRIAARISFACIILCPPAPPAWEIVSPPFGPVPAGAYQLEVEDIHALYPLSPVFLRQQVEAFEDEVLVRGGRFEIEIELAPPNDEKPRLAAPPSEDAALFYFFSRENWEVMVKVLDGCALNGHYWVYAAASTDLGYTLRVTDREAGGAFKEYRHEGGAPAPALTDGLAFPCSAPGPG